MPDIFIQNSVFLIDAVEPVFSSKMLQFPLSYAQKYFIFPFSRSEAPARGDALPGPGLVQRHVRPAEGGHPVPLRGAAAGGAGVVGAGGRPQLDMVDTRHNAAAAEEPGDEGLLLMLVGAVVDSVVGAVVLSHHAIGDGVAVSAAVAAVVAAAAVGLDVAAWSDGNAVAFVKLFSEYVKLIV